VTPKTNVGKMIKAALEEACAEITKTPASDHKALLKRMCGEANIVLGIVQDREPDNPILFVIKHDKSQKPRVLRAIPCRSLKEAELIRRVFGDPTVGQVSPPASP
jgi:hypothetical protein